MKPILALLLITVPMTGVPATCDFEAQASANAYVRQVGQLLMLSQCFGGPNDKNVLSRLVLEQLGGLDDVPMRTTHEVVGVQTQALGWLRDIDLSLSVSSSGVDPRWKTYFVLTQSRLSEARLQVSGFDARVAATPWTVSDLTYFDGTIDLKTPIRQSCIGEFDATCKSGLNAAAVLLRHAELTRAVLTKVVAERRLVPLYQEASALDAQWDTYFGYGRSQYLWELAFNSWLFERTIEANELAPPPKGQWILVHPTAAVEYVDNGKNEDAEFNAVAVVELVGYNRLTWDEGSMLNGWPLGVSAIATISLDDAGDTLGWGVMFHVRNTFSLGVARRDAGSGTETTWLLSADLGRLFLSVRDETRKRFRFGGH